MTKNFIPREFLNALNLPLQELKQPGFCSSSKAAKIEAWANSLQATKITQTSAVLYKSIPELNRVKTDFDNRFKSLEAVRPAIQNCILGLTRDFLHQPLILPEEAQKFAIIAQALQKNMIDGYLLCIREICNLSRFKPETLETLSKAIHRAITGIGLFFFRSSQLYTQIPRGMWGQLHGLYRVAEYYDLLNKGVVDSYLEDTQTITILSAWLRIVMLSTCRPNQLSQNDVAHAYKTFAQWAPLLKTNDGISSNKDNFYIVKVSQDEEPCYKSRFDGSERDQIVELDFKTLLGFLSKQNSSNDEALGVNHNASIPREFPDTLLNHLLNTWGNVAQRKLGRRDVNMSAEISVGIIDCHYFLAGKRKFDQFVNSLTSGADDWSSSSAAFTPRANSNLLNSNDERPTWMVTIQNVSAGGYCILWKGDIPPKLESGEVICLKEANRHSWNFGVVRWIKQQKNASQMGIQLLSNHASACGAAQVLDSGSQSDYMRAILLPPTNHNNTPASILTPRAPFAEMQKTKVLAGDRTSTIRLDKCVFSTGSVKQFAYTEMEGSVTTTRSNSISESSTPPQDFDSSWDDT